MAHAQAAPGDIGVLVEQLRGGGSSNPDADPNADPTAGGYGSGANTDFNVPFRPIEGSLSRITGPDGAAAGTFGPPVEEPDGAGLLVHWMEQPMDVAHHPTASLAFVAAQGSDSVIVLNSAASDPVAAPLARLAVGEGPRSVAVSPDGLTAYSLDAVGLTISELPLDAVLSMVSDEADATTPTALVSATRTAAFAAQTLPEAVARGRRIFHWSRNPDLSEDGRLACATCHVDGTDDHLVWLIREGKRQTPMLSGRLADTAPYNWLGTKPTLEGNMIQTIQRMGGAGLSDDDLSALASWLVEGLEPPPNPNLADSGPTAQQVAGEAIFNDPEVGCFACHSGPAYTDGALHDVGTAGSADDMLWTIRGGLGLARHPTAGTFDTPSLRGLHDTAPYLHDGSAATLHELLERTATTMGWTADLSPEELDALVAFLLIL